MSDGAREDVVCCSLHGHWQLQRPLRDSCALLSRNAPQGVFAPLLQPQGPTMRKLVALAPIVFFAAACSDGSFSDPTESSAAALGKGHMAVCPDAAPGEARCHAHVVIGNDGKPGTAATPSGY